jgi:hypothetical protein
MERASTPFPFVVFTFGLATESIKELGCLNQNAKVNNNETRVMTNNKITK